LSFLAQVVWMRDDYSRVLSTPIEAYNMGRFGQYTYIAKT